MTSTPISGSETNFDRPLIFTYTDSTGTFGGDQELFWEVSYYPLIRTTPSGGTIKGDTTIIVTRVVKGVPELGYLKYLLGKGARFVDDEKESIRTTFGGTAKELIDLLVPKSS